MVRTELGGGHSMAMRVAERLGYRVELVRLSVRQADIDDGHETGVRTAAADREAHQ